MEKVEVPMVTLSSGHKMPTLGLGTAARPRLHPDQLTSILVEAVAVGYRHFDTAASYGTEESVGRAVATALDRGLVQNRDEIFVTSKLSWKDTHYDLVVPALKDSLRKMELEYVDLYLIHWPVRVKRSAILFQLTEEDMLHFDIKGVWEGMEECKKLGLAKSIGVSNFSCAKLSKLLEHATIPPSVNQIEMNVAWQQHRMVEFCKERNIHVCAYSPLGAYGAFWGTSAVMENQMLKEIAASKDKSVAQVALRWVLEQGACLVVKSFKIDRLKENLRILDCELTAEEVSKIKQIPQAQRSTGERFVFPGGQYKTVEELWDGEI